MLSTWSVSSDKTRHRMTSDTSEVVTFALGRSSARAHIQRFLDVRGVSENAVY